MSRQKVALTTYIDSQGTELPIDFHSYTAGSEREWFCLFCDESIGNGEPVYLFKDGEAQDTGCNCCYECHSHTQTMIKHVYGIVVPKIEEGSDLSNNKIERFNVEGILGADAPMYYLHNTFLTTDNKEYKSKSHLCYFCDNAVTKDDAITIDDPRVLSSMVLGGRVNCCLYCESLLDSEDRRDVIHVVCSGCSNRYLIDYTEHENRERNKSQHYHLCPECCVREIARAYRENNELRFIANNHTAFIPERFNEQLCPTCVEYYEIDITLYQNYLLQRHKRYTSYPVCNKCNERLKNVDTIDSKNKLFILHISKTIFVVIEKFNKGWQYTIRQTREQGSDVLYRSGFTISSLAECTCVAQEEVKDLIYGKQGELFKP